MLFAYEAMRPDGTTVKETLEADDPAMAAASLREKGLLVLALNERAAAPTSARSGRGLQGNKVTARDRLLFTKQMKMLLESGAPLVPALEATRRQTARPAMSEMVNRLRERVEEGDSLAEALKHERKLFDPVFRSMVAAGEATASLPQVFGRLSDLSEQQLRTRKMVLGAAIYPMILCLLLGVVIVILLLFVVPRFAALFTSLGSPLPATTKFLFAASQHLKADWPYGLLGVAVLVVGVVFGLRLPGLRAWLDEVALRLPVIGRLMARLILARVLRIWASMLRCHVPLLEAIQLSREAITNAAFLRMIAAVEESVSSGGRMGHTIGATGLADPVIASAITTGEENGRLAEAVDFVSDWIDNDNASAIQNATRLAEPLLLAAMGVIVGFVALSLFVPLFDLATAAG